MRSATLTNDIATFRRFNRMYTRLIGTLNEGFLNSDFTLPEGRVLYELANRTSPNAKAIAKELDMDPGYLSRLLGKFERDGLLRRKTADHDGRYAELSLTPKGKSSFKKLNALSEKQAHTLLDRLPAVSRMQLIQCMQTIEAILKEKGDPHES
ncbi:MAG TPA: MarR family winged helix-turn-helix transcriptional regulator [Terriglobales bacterium]|nr:MarR family winged helix-turn-helix transcriptional regulator [Terriglobales bacterium]